MTIEPTVAFYLIKYTNEYLIVLLITIIAFVIHRFDRHRLLDFFISLILSAVVSEFAKYLFDTPRPAPVLGLKFEGGSFPSTHTALAFNALFFYLFCTRFNKSRGDRLKKLIHQVFPFVKSLNVIKMGELEHKNANNPYNTILTVGFLLMAITVSLLRIITGAHYIIDVIAGIIIGFVLCTPFMYYDIVRRKI